MGETAISKNLMVTLILKLWLPPLVMIQPKSEANYFGPVAVVGPEIVGQT